MAHLGNTPFEQNQRREGLLRLFRLHTPFFMVACLLPFVVFLAFAMDWVESKPSQDMEALEKAVALVRTPTGTGTAFLVSPSQLLTARHVVEDVAVGTVVNLTFERVNPAITATAKLVWKDQTAYPATAGLEYFLTDLAVLELTNPNQVADITPLELGESDAIKPLDKVLLFGYPGADFSASEGTINNERLNDLELFKLDATANPGNSGGPCLLAEDHTVIGMLVGKKTITESENIANKVGNIRAMLEKAGIAF